MENIEKHVTNSSPGSSIKDIDVTSTVNISVKTYTCVVRTEMYSIVFTTKKKVKIVLVRHRHCHGIIEPLWT